MLRRLQLRVRNVRVEIRTTLDYVMSAFEQDFSWFLVENGDRFDFELDVIPREYRFEGGLRFGPYRWKRLPDGTVLARFFEKATVAYRFGSGKAEVFCEDAEVAYEVAYSALLSFLGEKLDGVGVHRLHGLGVVLRGSGIVFLGSSGKGKSTLALSLLKHTAGTLLSDDIPFVSRNAKMYAFPQRIALREKPALEERHLRVFKRTQYGEKFLVSSDFYADRVQSEADVRWLVLLQRTENATSRFKKISRVRLLVPLLRWLVLGHETPQMLPLFVRLSVKDLISKARIACLRLTCAVALLARARAGKLYLSRDPGECARFLEGIQFDVTDSHRDSQPFGRVPELLDQRSGTPA